MSYQPPPHYGQWGPPPPAPQHNSGNATAALVLGIVGLTFCPIICAILAIVFGNIAFREIDGSGGRIGGRDAAKAGVILGWVGLGLWCLGILAYVAIIVFALAVGHSVDDSFEYSAGALTPLFAR